MKSTSVHSSAALGPCPTARASREAEYTGLPAHLPFHGLGPQSEAVLKEGTVGEDHDPLETDK